MRKQTRGMENQVLEPSLPSTTYVGLGYLRPQFPHLHKEVKDLEDGVSVFKVFSNQFECRDYRFDKKLWK